MLSEHTLVNAWLEYVTRQAKKHKIELLVWRIETAATQGVPDLWLCVDGVPVWLECKRHEKEIVYQPNQRKNLFLLKQQCHCCGTLVINEELQSWYLPPPQTAMEVGSKVLGSKLHQKDAFDAPDALLGLMALAYRDLNKARQRIGAYNNRLE